jgi:hypothetical protein
MATTDSASPLGPFSLSMAYDLPIPVREGEAYDLTFAGDGVAGDRVGSAIVTVERAAP